MTECAPVPFWHVEPRGACNFCNAATFAHEEASAVLVTVLLHAADVVFNTGGPRVSVLVVESAADP
jgi:hypothetical protein